MVNIRSLSFFCVSFFSLFFKGYADANETLLSGLLYNPNVTYTSGSAVISSFDDTEIWTSIRDVPASTDGSNSPIGINASIYWIDSATTIQLLEENNPSFLEDLPTSIDTLLLSKQVAALLAPKDDFKIYVNDYGLGTFQFEDHVFEANSSVKIIVSPNAGYTFEGWGSPQVSSANEFSFTITSDTIINCKLDGKIPQNSLYANLTSNNVTDGPLDTIIECHFKSIPIENENSKIGVPEWRPRARTTTGGGLFYYEGPSYNFGDLVKYNEKLFIYSPFGIIGEVTFSEKAVSVNGTSTLEESTIGSTPTTISNFEKALSTQNPEVVTSWKLLSDYLPASIVNSDTSDWNHSYQQSVAMQFCEAFDKTNFDEILMSVNALRFFHGLYNIKSDSFFDIFKRFNGEKIFEAESDGKKAGKALAKSSLIEDSSNYKIHPLSRYVAKVMAKTGKQKIEVRAYHDGWFYDPKLGWVFTTPKIFPILIHAASNSILQFCNTPSGHMFLCPESMIYVSAANEIILPIDPFWNHKYYGESLSLETLNSKENTPLKGSLIYDEVGQVVGIDKKDKISDWIKAFSLKKSTSHFLNSNFIFVSDPLIQWISLDESQLLTYEANYVSGLSNQNFESFVKNYIFKNPSLYNLALISDVMPTINSKADEFLSDAFETAKKNAFEDNIKEWSEIASNGFNLISSDSLPRPARYDFVEILNDTLVKREETFLHESHLVVFDNLSNYVCSKPYTSGWYYTPEDGWLWTNDETFPFIFRQKDGGWLYFYGSDEKSLFFDYNKNSFVNLSN